MTTDLPALAFPKPVHVEKKRKALRRVSLKRLANLRHGKPETRGGLPGKAVTVVNEKLLRTYHGGACEQCGSRLDVGPGHLIRRSHQRLDIPVNLVRLCKACNDYAVTDRSFEASLFFLKTEAERAELRSLAPTASIWSEVDKIQADLDAAYAELAK
jgi:hypothetical protein